jgi:hypothetical protein
VQLLVYILWPVLLRGKWIFLNFCSTLWIQKSSLLQHIYSIYTVHTNLLNYYLKLWINGKDFLDTNLAETHIKWKSCKPIFNSWKWTLKKGATRILLVKVVTSKYFNSDIHRICVSFLLAWILHLTYLLFAILHLCFIIIMIIIKIRSTALDGPWPS